MITYLKIYLYSGHTEFWVNQETIINKCVLLKSLAYKADFTSYFMHFFSVRVFFHGHSRLTGQQGKGGDHLLFHSTTTTRSRTFRHLFATLHVR